MEYEFIEPPVNNHENKFWSQTKHEFEKETDLSTFKNWPVVRSVPIYSENEFITHYTSEACELLNELPNDQYQKWHSVLKEPFLGHTKESYDRTVIHIKEDGQIKDLECTLWTLKVAHHLLTYEKLSGKSILDYDQIVDFGAGIGEIARVICDLGFTGDYYINDFPEVYRISNFYLGGRAKTVNHYSEIPQNKKTLFIGSWSLSEVPFNYRDEIANHFKGNDFLIIFQNQVFEYSNQPYFINRFPFVSDTFYRLQAIEWHPGGGGNFYMVCTGNKKS
jgi:putative sugar O-methyltransferase